MDDFFYCIISQLKMVDNGIFLIQWEVISFSSDWFTYIDRKFQMVLMLIILLLFSFLHVSTNVVLSDTLKYLYYFICLGINVFHVILNLTDLVCSSNILATQFIYKTENQAPLLFVHRFVYIKNSVGAQLLGLSI